jgi:tripartite-type tricarboxylate transporter receptor subunit TctC
VSSLIIASFVMVVSPASPANSVADFVKLVSSNPGKFSFGSGNAPSRIGGEMFKQMSRADLIHVPYKGAPQALTDLMGGQVSVMWTDIITGMPLVKGGKVKALAVTSQARLPIAPAIPTMKEQGFLDYELINWQGMYLPANTPPAITARLTALVHAAIRAEKATLEATGAQILPLSNTEFAALQARDTAMWASVVNAAGMTPE